MIKLFGGIGFFLYLRPKAVRISDKVPKRIKGGVLIAANHRSVRDPLILFLVFWYRRLYFPATEELFKKPLNRFFFKNMNCIMIERNSPNTSAVREMCGYLREDKAIAIFPEGAINTTEELLNYKNGTAFMAIRSGKPVLPVYIGKREKWWEPLYVIIGEAVDTVELCRGVPRSETVKKVSDHLRDTELALAEHYEELKRRK
jgi:1-acyl-sn-glycerol-3-phosphate acyltransferase